VDLWAALPAKLQACIEERSTGSLEGMAAALQMGEQYHGALLDSIHTEEHVWEEFQLAARLVCPRGLILIHDPLYPFGTVELALERIEASGYNDLFAGVLTLKARWPEEVAFSDLAVQRFACSCRLSVIVICYRYLQRLRIVLRNWCTQRPLPGSWEILVVNPQSPDGTSEHLAAVARSYPHVRVREIAVSAALATNKGAMINRALDLVRGDWIWLTDADCCSVPMHLPRFFVEWKGSTGTCSMAVAST
jgi:hypothetical protein